MALTIGSHCRCSWLLYFLLSLLCRARTVIRNIQLYHKIKNCRIQYARNYIAICLSLTLTPLLLHMLREDGQKMYQKCDEVQCCCFRQIEPYFSDVHVVLILIFRLSSVSLHKVLTLPLSILP